MGDFWDTVLGNAPAAPAPPPEDVPWWQRTLVALPPQPPPAAAPPPPSHVPPQTQDAGPAATLALTSWAKDTTGSCPGCGGSNYTRHPEFPNARPRCFDCGYPLVQSGTGIAVQGKEVGPVKAARQTVESRTNNYNPQQIVHHMHQ